MQTGFLEHVNITVTNAHKTAEMLCDLFGWKVRWNGPAKDGGTTYHVGTKEAYLAVYMPRETGDPIVSDHTEKGGLNHIGVVVENLEEIEKRVIQVGLVPHSHGDYEPGKRFYFDDEDGIEYEVVSYS